MADEWYFTQQGQQQGPVPLAQLKELAADGRLLPTDLVWREGMPTWSEAQWTRGLFSSEQFSAEPLPVVHVHEPAKSPVLATLDVAEPIPIDTERRPQPRSARRDQRRRSGAGPWIAILGGTLGLFVLVGAGVWAYFHFRSAGSSRSWSAAQGQTVAFHFPFTRGKKVEIWLNSNRDTDMDLFVYDANNHVVAVDDGDGKDCYVAFVPSLTQTYRVEVQNRVRMEPWQQHRNGPNSGILRFHESQHEDHFPIVNVPPPLPNPPGPDVIPPNPGPQTPPQVIPLRPGPGGSIVQGKLTRNDGTDGRHLGAFCKIYTYPMRAGKQYMIDLKSNNFDAYLRLEDARGWQLAEDDDGGGNQDARIVFTPPRDGTYRIIATTFLPGAVGDYRLSIRP